MNKLVATHMLTVGLMMVASAAMANDVTVDSQSPVLGKVMDDADQFITMTSENDKFFGNSDRHYTNGAQINYTVVKAQPDAWVKTFDSLLPFVDVSGPTAMSYSFGQQIYTPDFAGRPYAQPGDQPFAGFLFGKAGFTNYKADHADSYELTAGMVGPSAQGEFTQKTYHEAFDYYKPKGWDFYQLKDEPILNLSFVRRRQGLAAWEGTALGSNWFADVTPHYGFAVGNAYDYANAGGVVRFGPASARNNDVPGLAVPGLPGGAYFAKGGNWFDWYVFAGLDGRVVARDIFLDGNSFQSSPHVEKRNLVANATAGVTVITGKVKSSLTINQETQKFKGQTGNDVYGAINVGYRF